MKVETERKWAELTPDEKRAERFKRWQTPPEINFVSPEAEQSYQARQKRLADAYQMKEPDRVPVQLRFGTGPAYYAGTARDIKEYCRQLIEHCAPGGGYILSTGATVNKAPAENMRAIMEAAKEYGVYK